MNILILIWTLFSQSIDMSAQCASNGCIVNGIPFGTGRDLVKWQMRSLAPSTPPHEDGSLDAIGYGNFPFWRWTCVNDIQFGFNSSGELDGIDVFFTPNGKMSQYPELYSLYTEIRDELIASGNYDSVEYRYKFKAPFPESNEVDAEKGEYTYAEMEAMRKDGNLSTSNRKFAQVWSKFKSKVHPIDVIIQIAYAPYSNTIGGDFVVVLSFKDRVRSMERKSKF